MLTTPKGRVRRGRARRAQTVDDLKLVCEGPATQLRHRFSGNGVSSGSADWVLLRIHGWMLEAQSVPGVAQLAWRQGNHVSDTFHLITREDLSLQQEIREGQICLGQVSEGCGLRAAGDEEPLPVGTEAQMHE